LRGGTSVEVARAIIEQYLTWTVVEHDGPLLLGAIGQMVQHRISFWDALVVQAAVSSGCEILYSQDLSAGPIYTGVRVVSPFAK
jgi:predicted nucleic acid-binding protein